MRVEYVTTAMQAVVTRGRDSIEAAYDRLPDTTAFWAIIDLVESSNFRLARGPKEGYVRGETFFTLVRNVIAPCSEVRLIKEMGDAVFLTSTGLRPLLEAVVLIDQIANQMSSIAGTDSFPFAVRSAIGFGTAKRLVRHHDDFLGHSIDRLSRLLNARSDGVTIRIDDEAFRTCSDILDEYSSWLSFSESIQLSQEQTKSMGRNVYYRELRIDRKGFIEFEDHFVPWKSFGLKHPSM